jgi:hypothetical protein
MKVYFLSEAQTNHLLACGMGLDLGAALAMGTVWVGNPLSFDLGFSIGGLTELS